MSKVSLSIGGRSFSVACADGEEAHITDLGNVIDSKVRALGTSAGQNEVRMLLYAALVLADELHEAAINPAPSPNAAPQPPAASQAADASRLERIAITLENLAADLERGLPSA